MYGKIRVENWVQTKMPDLTDPNVVEQIWAEARRIAREEAPARRKRRMRAARRKS